MRYEEEFTSSKLQAEPAESPQILGEGVPTDEKVAIARAGGSLEAMQTLGAAMEISGLSLVPRRFI